MCYHFGGLEGQSEGVLVNHSTTWPPKGIGIRTWREADFPAIQTLSAAEGWNTAAERPDEVLEAWRRSGPALVAVQMDSVIGFLRALGDGAVTIYVAELLVAPQHRGQGIAGALLCACQDACPGTRLDLLATPDSRGYYERLGFRSWYGFRRSWAEYDPSLRSTGRGVNL